MSCKSWLMRFSVFLSWDCHTRYSSKPLSVNEISYPIGHPLQFLYGFYNDFSLPGLLNALAEGRHIALAVKWVGVY